MRLFTALIGAKKRSFGSNAPVGQAVGEIGHAGDDVLGGAELRHGHGGDEQRVVGGVVEHGGVGGDAAEHRQPVCFGVRERRDDDGGSAIVERARVAGRHGCVVALPERGAELGEHAGRGVGARTFIRVDHGVALLAGDGHRDDLVLELARLLGCHRLHVRQRGELVLLRAGDLRLLRRILGVAAHVDVARRAPEPIADHAVHHLLIAELHAVAHAVDVVRRVGHRLHPAGDDDFGVARLDGLGREHHGLEPGAADLVDGHGADTRGNARLEHRLPRRRLPHAALHDIAHDDFFHVGHGDTGALKRGADRRGAELGGSEG